jgi:4-hydroxybenzoate polyprenyltransferase
MWPALWALWIAGEGMPAWWIVAIFLMGTFLMRSAGCAINDYADRHIDGHVARTQHRPLATGVISAKEALAVFVLLSLLAFGLVLFLNWQTIALSFVAVALAALYPFMKRFTHLPQMVLGMAFGCAIPMAFTAITNDLPWVALPLYLSAVAWALIYDTEYAMVDREDDLKIGVKSTAILFGRYDRLIIGLFQLIMLSLLLLVGVLVNLGPFYYLGLVIASGLALYQQYLIRERQREACFKAFLNNNSYGMTIFIGLLLDYLLR